MRVCVPLGLEHWERDGQREQVDRVEAGEAGAPELSLDQRRRAVDVVVREDVAGEKKENGNQGVGGVDHRRDEPHVRRGEVEEHDGEGKQGAETGERRQIRPTRGRRGE